MYAVPGAGSPGNRRFALKQATSAAHDRVEAIIQSGGMFDSVEGYRRYLSASYRTRAGLERQLDLACAERIWPDWPGRRIARLIAADIADLGGAAPSPQSSSAALLSPPELLGVMYVVEGSSLGARVLVGMTDRLGLSASFGARHLHHQAADRAAWRSFLACLDAFDTAPSASAALAAFDMFADAYSRELAL